MRKLSARLELVYENLIPSKDVWDICCDHGLLGAAAYESRKFSEIYFVDRVPSIMNQLTHRFQKFVFKVDSPSKAIFICAAGQDIKIKVTGTFCVTGVGGLTAFKILKALSENGILNADRLIIGPHRDEEKLLASIETLPYLKKYLLKSEFKILENGIQHKLYVFDKVK